MSTSVLHAVHVLADGLGCSSQDGRPKRKDLNLRVRITDVSRTVVKSRSLIMRREILLKQPRNAMNPWDIIGWVIIVIIVLNIIK